MTNSKKTGLLQSLGVTFYCSLMGIIFWKGDEIFGKVNRYLGPVTFLLLFAFSVLFCGLMVFYKPYKLFLDGKKKEASEVVLFTAIGLSVAISILLTLLILLK